MQRTTDHIRRDSKLIHRSSPRFGNWPHCGLLNSVSSFRTTNRGLKMDADDRKLAIEDFLIVEFSWLPRKM
jgi:hypothetical protein